MKTNPLGQHRIKHLRLPEFTGMKSYWDANQNVEIVRILAGEYYVTHCEEMITTVLGSCISVCVRDRVISIGGMNHFMLPEEIQGNGDPDNRRRLSADAAYGSYAMERLINCILKYGGRRENLEIKIFGGGRIIGGMADIGRQNIAFVRGYLHTERLPVMAEDVGGDYPRRMAYLPVTGRVLVKKLRNFRSETILKQESSYRENLRRESNQGGEVELFGDFG